MSSPILVPSPSAGDASDHSPEVLLVRRFRGLSARNRPAVGVAPTILCLDFPNRSTGMIDRPEDVCVYERMFLHAQLMWEDGSW